MTSQPTSPAKNKTPLVAVVGRPNVGKSSLCNRILGKREAVTDSFAGVTRDRKTFDAEWSGLKFSLMDTGGWMEFGDELASKVSDQALKAARDADVILLVIDAQVGVTTEDERVTNLLRRSGAPIIVVANKVDSERQEADAWSASSLGVGDMFMVSAVHGRGSGDLLDAVVNKLRERGYSPEEPPELRDFAEVPEEAEFRCPAVAIVGRPNVGKSTLFNRMVGDERSITHDEAGTTRDSVDTIVETEHGSIRFVDTAGLRRRSRIDEGVEYYSLVRALAAIDRSEIAVVVIDGNAGVTHQDQRLAERVDAAGSPVVIVINKWELLSADRRQEVLRDVEDRLSFLGYAPILKISALTGLGVHKLLPAIRQATEAYGRRIPTSELNKVINQAQLEHPAPSGARVLYATQGAIEPPTFTFFSNRVLPRTYLRYLERKIRESFGFGPTPLKIRARQRAR